MIEEQNTLQPTPVISHRRILLVDDEVGILKLLTHLLGRAGYHVDPCPSSKEALKKIQTVDYDCVITDAVMPDIDGIELVRRMRQNDAYRDRPIIMLTRRRDREDVRRALEAGVSDYLLKPVDDQILLDKVRLSLKNFQEEREISELVLTDDALPATVQQDVWIVAMSETSVTLRTSFQVHPDMNFKLFSQVFDEIDLPTPFLKLVESRQDYNPKKNQHEGWRSVFSLVGVPEKDLKKIRSWIRKEVIRRRK